MKRATRIAALILPALLLAAGALRAQHIPSPYTFLPQKQGLGLYAGYLLTDPTVSVDSVQTADFGPQSAPLIGLDYNLRVSSALVLRAGVAVSPSERKVYRAGVTSDSNTVSPVYSGSKASMPLAIVDVGMRLNLTGSRTYRGLAPWVAAGGGVVSWLKKTSPLEADVPAAERFTFGPAFALSLQAGTDWYPTPRLSLGVHAADYLWKLKVPRGFVGGVTKSSEWTNNLGVTAGAAIHF
ncbi:MAG: hypothetical protein JWM27_2633 [Gemmatimonadetes bacterium]|nr:hypothetical protein [Gemmatimonadota bacterium]